MLANEQLHMVNKDGEMFEHMTVHARMAIWNYIWCDSSLPKEILTPEIHYKVNLSQTIGGVNLVLCDGGANGCIKGNSMKVLYYTSDGRCVSISIAGNNQLTGARLCTGVLITTTNQGWVKLIWHQWVEVTTPKNSIIPHFKVRSH